MKRTRIQTAILALAMSLLAAALTAQAPAAAGSKIVRNPSDLPAPVGARGPQVVEVPLTAQEVVGALDPANHVYYRYWTFNGKVPGPMIRARVGDTVAITLHNDAKDAMVHSIDVHAAMGPGGGAAMMQVPPGKTKSFAFVATIPGLYVYHCATPQSPDHIANGMFGMILVEPAGGLPKVDHEYYIMQSEIYTAAPGKPGQLLSLDEARLMAETPQYFVFNGAIGSLTQQFPLAAAVGQSVRIFFGNAGPNATSSLHMVGEIFTKYDPFGSFDSAPLTGVQTASIPPGGAGVFELQAVVPGQFVLVDHALVRVQKGLAGFMNVTGTDTAHLMTAEPSPERLAHALPGVTAEDAAAAALPASAASEPAAVVAHLTAPPAASAAGAPVAGAAAAAPAAADAGSAKQAASRALNSYLDALHGNPEYARYATAMLQQYKDQPASVPVAWRDLFDAFAHPPAPLEFSMASGTADSMAAVSFIGKDARVTMSDAAYLPAVIEVSVGQTVTWINTSATIHTVVDDTAKAVSAVDVSMPMGSRPFSSPFLVSGQVYTKVFAIPGVYHYVCTQHEHNGMVGTVIVRPARAAIASR